LPAQQEQKEPRRRREFSVSSYAPPFGSTYAKTRTCITNRGFGFGSGKRFKQLRLLHAHNCGSERSKSNVL
jgi:hypothetical protein